jgi:copper chaperone CopZ
MKEIIKITDMHCSNCAMKIESLEDVLPGISRIDASYQRGEMEVEYDEQVIDTAVIRAAVRRLGYQPAEG